MALALLGIAPIVSFGLGYFYGSYNSNVVTPPLPPALIQEIQKGVQLKKVDSPVKNIVWSSHDQLLKEIHRKPSLKHVEVNERKISDEEWLKELKSKLKHINENVMGVD